MTDLTNCMVEVLMATKGRIKANRLIGIEIVNFKQLGIERHKSF